MYAPRGLVPGEYEMIGFNQANDAITARAGFTFVVQAATCDAPAPHQTVVDRQVCDENMRAFKVAAERMAERSRLVAALGLIGGRMLVIRRRGGLRPARRCDGVADHRRRRIPRLPFRRDCTR